MKFYIDVPVERIQEHHALRDFLILHGNTITHDWTEHFADPVETKAINDIQGVVEADFVVALLPGGRAFQVEIGAALATGVPVFLIGNPLDAEGKKCVFYEHPLVTCTESLEVFMIQMSRSRL